MMLSDELRQHLMDLADENGVDPELLIAMAEAETAARAGATAGTASDTTATSGMTAFEPHAYPFLRVNEIRERLGVAPADDGDLWSGEWLAKHGGNSTGPSSAA
jgi:hypothetical protein